MSKLTPMILAILMLASTSLVALDWAELEQKDMIEADGRSGPDAEVVSILSPRATTTDTQTGEMQHTLFAGDDVNFETFISNAGDVAITEMGISVTVYLSEGGARGMIAKDAAGNDLSWNNGDVICDDSFVCPWSSLDVGANLANGKYTMTYLGSVVSWAPITGDYVVVVETNAFGDNAPGNDYSENLVSVVDWTDIIVDLAWDSGKEVEGGSGDKAFTLTVGTGGSSSWSARSIILDMTVTGALDSAVNSGGVDILGTNLATDFGTGTTTETFRHQDDVNNTTSAMRYVIDFQDESTWNGVVTPSTQVSTGDYSVEVSLVSYVLYGQQPDCVEEVTTRGTGPNGEDETMTYIHYCEVLHYSDDVSSTSESVIEGKVQNFHDIGVTNLAVNQGYSIDENGAAMGAPTMPGMTSGPLNPAWSSVQASVRHLGNNMMETYDWEVNFEIENTITGVTHTETANSCTFGFGEVYTHLELGEDPEGGTAFEMGEACIMFNFGPGIYNLTATVSMINIDQMDDGTGTMVDAYADMSARNDDASIYEIIALNNRPSVTLTLENTEDVVIGPEGTITIVANADDADDQGGLALSYIWTHPGMPEGQNDTVVPSMCNGVGPAFSTCQLIALDAEWAGVQTYSVEVLDPFNSSAKDFLNVFVWNHIITTSTTDSGIEMVYDLTYDGANAFSVSLADSSEGPYTQDLTNFGYAGEYTSVAVLDYSPSTTYMPEDVYAQSITMNYDASTLAPTSAFWISNGNWAKLEATITAAGSDGSISIDMGQNGQVLSQGEIVLMGGELQIIEAPEGNPAGLNVVATAGGQITATWSYVGTTVPGFDWLSMEICDSNGDCDTSQENTTLAAHSMSGQTDTEHGVTYTYTLSVCNVGGCHPTIATGSAVADKEVDGDAVATEMSVYGGVDNSVMVDGETSWVVSWVVGGTDSSDVAGWKVCWTDYSWSTAGAMPATCADAGAAVGTTASSRESVEINHPGGTGTKTYYFVAVPYDDKGNMDNAEPGTDSLLEHKNTQVDPCETDPDSDECANIGDAGDDAEGGSVPTWTWGVIIGLVVVAFVVGAFILSRGGDGEDGKDWDY